MQTTNEIEIVGTAERIFQLAANLQDWPKILPHYRYMQVLENSERHKVADFGASRDGFPCKWRAQQELFPEENRIIFRHIGGITKGMWVEWRLVQKGKTVHVAIEHRLTYPIPLMGKFFADVIVGRLFVENIAGKTLRCFKALVEREGSSM